ncbi:hypothetical protein KCP78_13145 [Salmonella enterica subsp. enterica]|nr:hypothetical protein KCP78_13145 [Salmonella enterica subsp. enterica]
MIQNWIALLAICGTSGMWQQAKAARTSRNILYGRFRRGRRAASKNVEGELTGRGAG